jgi:hypothetical protein
MTPNQRKLAFNEAANVDAARRILADPRLYEPGSLLQRWAVLYLSAPQGAKRDRQDG